MTILNAKQSLPLEGGPSFSLGNRAMRAVWIIAWLALAAWTPPPFHRWRRFVLTLFGAKVAPTAAIYGSARVWYPPLFEAGDHARIGPHATVYCMAKITVGDYAIVSQGAHLCAGTHDISDPHFQLLAKPITIGPRAWIAAEAFVGPGVTVGEGAVLGARAVAFDDLHAWTVYAGNPAARLKARVMREEG